jgi:adenine-specific DNA-methyltransferase
VLWQLCYLWASMGTKVGFKRALQMTPSLFDGSMTGAGEAASPRLDFVEWPVANASEAQLVRLALELGAGAVGGNLSEAERKLAERAGMVEAPSDRAVDETRAAILAGRDPLGEALCRLRPGPTRRALGAFYTPPALIDPMVDWVFSKGPSRLVDPGCGSGRFVAVAVRRSPNLPVIAVDVDPVASLITRAALVVLGATRARVLQADYLQTDLEAGPGPTAFIGNPPYVRHHDLSPALKRWASKSAKRFGRTASGLAGLHTYFFLATALRARPGDIGCFLTSAEWLDVNYGSLIRELLLHDLGVESLDIIDPRAVPFDDAMATAVVTCFRVGTAVPTVRVRHISPPAELVRLEGGNDVPRGRLEGQARWTPIARDGHINGELQEGITLRAIARVHRGVVTGANDFFVLPREQAQALGVERWCRPAITSAKEILESGGVIRDSPDRRLLLCIPKDVDRRAHPDLDRYLRTGETAWAGQMPVSERYISRHRRPWWHLGPCGAPPIVVTYMARQAPVFALNPDGLALINIAHGIYPKAQLATPQFIALVNALNETRQSYRGAGRTYQGGLEKFEPGEMESLIVPKMLG